MAAMAGSSKNRIQAISNLSYSAGRLARQWHWQPAQENPRKQDRLHGNEKASGLARGFFVIHPTILPTDSYQKSYQTSFAESYQKGSRRKSLLRKDLKSGG
jgi:hypothetical protein